MVNKTVRMIIVASALFAFSLWVGQVQATTYNLALSGTVANGSSGYFDSGATHYDYWSLQLEGLSSSNAITVSPGDEIVATVALDQLLSLPTTSPSTNNPLYLTWVEITLTGSNFPSVDTQADSKSTVFSNGGSSVFEIGPFQSTTTNGRLVNAVTFLPQALSFDTLLMDFTIPTSDTSIEGNKNLFNTAQLDGSRLGYWLFSSNSPVPTPEPTTLLFLSFGLMGVAAAVRRFKK
jgi:hypothetical protein